MKPVKNGTSRAGFLGAGLVVGGALYRDPLAAMAGTGGRPILGGMVAPMGDDEKRKEPPIGKYVPNLPGNTGTLTLADLAAFSFGNNAVIQQIGKTYLDVTYSDIGDIIAYVIQTGGANTPLLTINVNGGININRCCCCCCFVA